MNNRNKLNEYFHRVDALERELSERKIRDAYKVSIEDTRKELEKSETLYKEAEELKRMKDLNTCPNSEQIAVDPFASFAGELSYDYELELERQRTELEEAQLIFLQEKLNHQIEENIRLKKRLAYRYHFVPNNSSEVHTSFANHTASNKMQEESAEKEETILSDDRLMSVAPDSSVNDGNARLSFAEAYALLTSTQKHFCDGLLLYACKHSGKKRRDAKYYVSVGCGFNQIIKVSIKYNTIVVCARMEDYTLRNLRLSDTDTPIKTRETSVKVVDNSAYETAKRLIDLRIEQIAEFIVEKKLMLKEKRKASTTSRKSK